MERSSKAWWFQYTSTFSPLELKTLQLQFKLESDLLGDNLSGDVHLVGKVEDIKSNVVGDVGEIDFLIWGKTELGDELDLLSGDARNSSHDFVDIGRTVVEVITDGGVVEELSDVFHGVRTFVWWKRTRLSHWVDVSHVSDWGWWRGVEFS